MQQPMPATLRRPNAPCSNLLRIRIRPCNSPIRFPTARSCTRRGAIRRLQPFGHRHAAVALRPGRRSRAERSHRLRSRHRPLGRYLERVRSRPRAGQLYHFQADGPFEPERGQRFDGRARLIDPYARALAGEFLPGDDGIIRPPKCVVVDDSFDWQGDRHLRREPVRHGDLRDARPRLHPRPSSGVEHPGTYLGVIEKIPYLKSLGVTAVELMPVHEFPTNGILGRRTGPAELLGLRPAGVLRAAPRLRGRHRAGLPGRSSSSRWCGPCTRPASK